MGKRSSRMPKEKKSSNMTLFTIVIVVLLAIACLNGRYVTPQQGNFADSEAEFQVHVIDVGQADSILVIADGEAMLIDAAETGNAGTICEYLRKCGVKSLKYAVATHMHADHIGGFPGVLEEFKAETVLEPVYADSLVPTTRVYERYLDAVEANSKTYHAAEAGETFALGGAKITVVGPVSKETDDMNNTSLVLRVDYDEASCLFTGDMETPEEESIIRSGAKLNVDFLKVGHHGAATSSGRNFLAMVMPQYAVISCGVDNDYGHPAESTMERLKKFTKEIHITAEEGSVVFSYDKETGACKIVSERSEEHNAAD